MLAFITKEFIVVQLCTFGIVMILLYMLGNLIKKEEALKAKKALLSEKNDKCKQYFDIEAKTKCKSFNMISIMNRNVYSEL